MELPGGGCGWHLHRHRLGLQFRVDTTNRGWDFHLATSGDLDLATNGDFFMAMDSRSARSASTTAHNGRGHRCPRHSCNWSSCCRRCSAYRRKGIPSTFRWPSTGHKVPDDEVPSDQWDNTTVGELVYRAKYFVKTPPKQRAAHAGDRGVCVSGVFCPGDSLTSAPAQNQRPARDMTMKNATNTGTCP